MISTARRPIAVAKVQWWTDKSIHILCPFCDEIHQHGFDGDYSGGHLRVAHCNYRLSSTTLRAQEYELAFPLGGYEIDKDNLRFVAGGARIPEENLDQQAADKLRDDFRAIVEEKPLWTDIEEFTLESEELSESSSESLSESEKFDRIVSDMVLGDVKSVRQYLSSTSKARRIFLYGVESWNVLGPEVLVDDELEDHTPPTSGKTTLHLAACEKYPQVVELLLEEGADVNAPDLDGRTPLMEAALWGRLENIEILLHHGADVSSTCIHNNHLRCAADFARRLSDNEKTRRARKGYNEDSYRGDFDRREILRLLEDPPPELSTPQLDSFTFSKPLKTSTTLSLTTHYSLPSPWKTVARLIRGEVLPEISAMSGWAHSQSDNIQVAGQDLTPDVLSLCKVINFTLDPYPCDQGIPGRFNACHAEKQLIAYFIHKHIFLSTELIIPEQPNIDIDDFMATLSLVGVSDEALERNWREHVKKEEERIYRTKLVELSQASPAVRVQEAVILSSRPTKAFLRFDSTEEST
ncbi:hypothetical protein FSARC_10768 [Fusarium sarcochroum]|uniref:Single-strand DNA deaminase toxin A-like C-terminal domain-containing protein n=1 Tax=Fusarium sarcochroum TaxID=1208366 RepID=A0A8H4X289_9HYPO|nr:hypothetical protein FSARC_10768 [Fusarium sarcochroum]